MNRTALFFAWILLLLAQSLSAQDPGLQRYVERSLPLCPQGKVTLSPSPNLVPPFKTYKAQLTSAAGGCGRETEVFVSAATKQVLVAHAFALPRDSRTVEARLTDLARQLLKNLVSVSLSRTALEDGLREATFVLAGKEGRYELRGYVDAGGTFLLVGRRGRLDLDPRKALLSALPSGAKNHRGSADGAISIVEISDLQCPTCKQAHDLVTPFVEKNLGRVSYTRIDLPIYDIHDWSLPATLAARAIREINPEKYWSFVDYVFANQANVHRANLDLLINNFLDDQAIDRKRFSAMQKSAAAKQAVLRNSAGLYDLGLMTAPTFLVNGQEVFYGQNGAHLKAHLQKLLEKRN